MNDEMKAQLEQMRRVLLKEVSRIESILRLYAPATPMVFGTRASQTVTEMPRMETDVSVAIAPPATQITPDT